MALSDEVGDERTLLVCCGAFRAKANSFPNLTLKKIPNAVLNRCEFGRDDYSLEIAELPEAPEEEQQSKPHSETESKINKTSQNKKKSSQATLPLFEQGEET